MGRLLASALALALIAGPAVACLNDSELPGQEQEFRSQYTRMARPVGRPSGAPNHLPVVLGGLAMLGSATALILLDGRSKG